MNDLNKDCGLGGHTVAWDLTWVVHVHYWKNAKERELIDLVKDWLIYFIHYIIYPYRSASSLFSLYFYFLQISFSLNQIKKNIVTKNKCERADGWSTL